VSITQTSDGKQALFLFGTDSTLSTGTLGELYARMGRSTQHLDELSETVITKPITKPSAYDFVLKGWSVADTTLPSHDGFMATIRLGAMSSTWGVTLRRRTLLGYTEYRATVVPGTYGGVSASYTCKLFIPCPNWETYYWHFNDSEWTPLTSYEWNVQDW
jgi:hypothetical protein